MHCTNMEALSLYIRLLLHFKEVTSLGEVPLVRDHQRASTVNKLSHEEWHRN